ncbi:Acyl transferase domain-containing protein [Rhizobiales bacterium GAS188]|nr:Acyl transferase domain-containing protein [Rhizobiales bacterium GAS188]
MVGIGCRFPGGANDPESFWRLLCDGVEVTREVPPDRWNMKTFYHPELATPGRSHSRRGGFLDSIALFDIGFFGISPREAAAMDPQQRLLLEVTFEAIEDAGLQLEALARSPTGVYVGLSAQDYMLLQNTNKNLTDIDAHSLTGVAMSIAANRISYCLNLHGPSMAVDTACSSSLVAVHLACQGLWSGDCDSALAGGVNILITPDLFINFSRMAMLSPTGSCKAFDASADGFARGEGAAVVVLKRYSDAVRDGDSVYAQIRATAVNQDGHTSSLTVPGEEAQVALLRRVCMDARILPDEVQYIEAHGTGTPVGDPIEARALAQVFCERRSNDNPCFIGSVKSNIGHLEPASGIAGLVKAALAVKHRQIPPNPNFRVPNPNIPFERLKLRVPTELQAWPDPDRPLLAAVSSFGFGGTNAHAILEQGGDLHDQSTLGESSLKTTGQTQSDREADTVSEPALERPRLFVFSARGTDALRSYVEACRTGPIATAVTDSGLDDFAWSCAVRRNHHHTRLCVTAGSREELLDLLAAYADDQSRAGIATGRADEKQPPQLAFVFSGQGPQWWGMGRELLEQETVFRGAIEECDAQLRMIAPWSLLQELMRDETSSRMNDPSIAQPAIFALQYALARLWSSWGIQPAAVAGHSVGEVAAACVAGALTFPQAVELIYHRGRCMDFEGSHGRMLAVGVSAQEALSLLSGHDRDVAVAAINGPQSVTLSGDGEALAKIAVQLESRQVFCSFLRVDRAFHSPRLDPMQGDLIAALAGLQPSAARIPLYSTVTGARCSGEEMGADYWWRNARQTVQFASAILAILEAGHHLFVEVSPHPVLSHAVLEIAGAQSRPIQIVPSQRRGEPEKRTLLNSLGALYARGVMPDWKGLLPAGRFVPLPHYPWQRERHWNESRESERRRIGPTPHPLLGERQPTARPIWEQEIHLRHLRYLAGHRVGDHVVFPAAALVEMAVAAARECRATDSILLEDVDFQSLCLLSDDEGQLLQLILDANETEFNIFSRSKDTDRWTSHARGKVRTHGDTALGTQDVESVRRRCPTHMSQENVYRVLEQIGLRYGPGFRGVAEMWIGSGEALGLVRLSDDLLRLDGSPADYCVQPALLDSCFHVIFGTLPHCGKYMDNADGVFLPVGVERVRILAPLRTHVWSHARLRHQDDNSLTVDVDVLEATGAKVVEVRGLHCRLLNVQRSQDELIYQYCWVPCSRPEQGQAGEMQAAKFSPRAFLETISAETRRIESQHGLLEKYYMFDTDIGRLCDGYIGQCFQDLGIDWRVGARVSPHSFLKCGVQHRFERLVRRYCEILCQDGLLRRIEDDYEISAEFPVVDLNTLWNECLNRNPGYYAEFIVVRRCGSRLAELLRGHADPLQVLFAHDSPAIPDQLYQDAPIARVYNTLSQWAVAEFVERFPRDRDIRILEIGSGTGGLTSYVLTELPADRTKYVFSDISAHFFIHAREKFRDYENIEYRKLDIDSDPAEQGFGANEYDIVLASQVLHATKDLRRSLQRVRRLLRPGGLFVLLEPVRPVRWADLTFGLTEGWWSFSDHDLRSDYPLLSLPRWRALLEEQGFDEVTEISGVDEDAAVAAALLALSPHQQPQLSGEAMLAEAADAPAQWILFADRNGVAERLRDQLASRSQRCLVAHPGDEYRRIGPDEFQLSVADREHLVRLFKEVAGGCRGVVHLGNLDLPRAGEMSTVQLDAALVPSCLSIVHIVQALSKTFLVDPPQLWIVTSNVHAVITTDTASGLAQSPAWGVGRVVTNEAPLLRATLVDLSAEVGTDELKLLCAELLRPEKEAQEDELALRGSTRYVHRLHHVRDRFQCAGFDQRLPVGSQPYCLDTSRLGALDKLALFSVDRPDPGPDEVEIQVAATGLNFSDVMKALGVLPNLPPGPLPLGLECSGVVSAVGANVTRFKVGDEVVATANFCFASFVRTRAEFVVPKPPNLSFEAAATLPVAFLTAYYALHHVGQLRRGERVLIHSASGAVGLAAIQVARRIGSEVMATAGTSEKREFLRQIGIEHVWDSRTLAFADGVLEATAGRGVDVVLNSLAGEGLVKSLDVLAPHGRFLEIGKRDIYADSRIGLKPFRKQISMTAIDLMTMQDRPQFFFSIFEELMRDFGDGAITPLLHRVFPVTSATAAFRYMAQAKHIGKVVISTIGQKVRVRPPRQITCSFRDDATYLITGGLGGFGLLVAEWMIAHGARHLVLVGRRAVPNPEQQSVIDELRATGTDVRILSADVSRAEDVSLVLAKINDTLPRLRGVIHAAMVLNDSLLVNMTEEQLREVWAPKVSGAWNLHLQTLDTPLDFFVLFSSMACILGSAGQSNYAAANAMLDALAEYRHSRGLAACTISWGSLGDVGWVARHGDVAERMKSQGILQFSPRQALALLGQFMAQKPTTVGVVNMDWRQVRGRTLPPKFAQLTKAAAMDDENPVVSAVAVRAGLLAATPDRRAAMLQDILRQRVARVLGAPPDKIDVATPLTDLGLDSLMGIEIKNWIESELRLNLPTVELIKGPTIEGLVKLLLEQLAAGRNAIATPSAIVPTSSIVADRLASPEHDELASMVKELSDDEVDVLLDSPRLQPTLGQ